MRFYTSQHQHTCGIDLHARTMYICILGQDQTVLVERNIPAHPEPFLKLIARTERILLSALNVSSPGTGWRISARRKGSHSFSAMPST